MWMRSNARDLIPTQRNLGKYGMLRNKYYFPGTNTSTGYTIPNFKS